MSNIFMWLAVTIVTVVIIGVLLSVAIDRILGLVEHGKDD